jgi:hypothetical protein
VSFPFLRKENAPVFPETETSWMMSGSGSSLSEPWKAIDAYCGRELTVPFSPLKPGRERY